MTVQLPSGHHPIGATAITSISSVFPVRVALQAHRRRADGDPRPVPPRRGTDHCPSSLQSVALLGLPRHAVNTPPNVSSFVAQFWRTWPTCPTDGCTLMEGIDLLDTKKADFRSAPGRTRTCDPRFRKPEIMTVMPEECGELVVQSAQKVHRKALAAAPGLGNRC